MQNLIDTNSSNSLLSIAHKYNNGPVYDNKVDPDGKLPFTIPSRTIVSKGSKPGQLVTFHLEEARDYLRKLTAAQNPVDHDRSLNQLHIGFSNGHMEGRFMNQKGLDETRYLLTETGAQHLAKEVLPTRFFSGLKELARMDETGEKLATMTWAKFGAKADSPRMLRTVNVSVNGQSHRAIRSCHSQGYAPYSNLQFVEDLLDNAGDFAQYPVLDWKVSDSVMRLRFAGCGETGIELNKPVPMLECWNSEVGMRRVGLRGGMFKLVCTNGCGHWDDKKEFSWIHRGDSSRIQNGVKNAFEDLLVSAKGVVNAYQQALDVSVDDMFAWMEREMNKGEASTRQVIAAQTALNHPTTTPGATLASAVDAITLIAQDESDLIASYELERLAAEILRRGLSQALRQGNNRIMVEA